jgi:hypothetical protein
LLAFRKRSSKLFGLVLEQLQQGGHLHCRHPFHPDHKLFLDKHLMTLLARDSFEIFGVQIISVSNVVTVFLAIFSASVKLHSFLRFRLASMAKFYQMMQSML